ncbi:SDR family NAD(P)-dependent oxidoreductase [Arthrobacter castelli]|uniref:SDR family NAD(P)-dependent oxidoreductase n=1 Tax=Arthrobacter castelli TaxID=271431 RepID=UPI000428791F|nr:SDR family NAD(P)-dependent oxidoreductase [Arthrobacter castelli]
MTSTDRTKSSTRSVVAVVTGAARGIGRGIALALGDIGATIYVADRETRNQRHSELPGTVEDTAEQVENRGGHAIPVSVDVTQDSAVDSLFARVRAERGGLDLLVANAFDGNALPFAGGPFWTLPWQHWHNMIDAGLRGHALTAWHAAPC